MNMTKSPECNDKQFSHVRSALRSEDTLTQNEGVAAAIQMGAVAVPVLMSLLNEPEVCLTQVIYALAQIGDSRAQPAFVSGLRNSNERVRAYAAQGLARIGHPEALAACLQTLNDAADELHVDQTPAVQALGEMGLKTVPALLRVLMDPDEITRLHGQRALQQILSRRHGFRSGLGFPSPDAAESMLSEWRANGDYDYRADASVRSESVSKWQRWLAATQE